jgi:hypothetical protein
MDRAAISVRRIVGGLALLGALALLIAGETVLKARLQNLVYLFYWLTCITLTAIAIGGAFLDVRDLQRRTRREQRDLLEATFKKLDEPDKVKRQVK